MEGKNRGPSPRPLGVYGQILLGFGAFTLVIAALLWVFQIFLLGPFYQLIKTDQVENTAEAVLRQLDEPQDTLRQTVEDLCYDTDINILVIDENGRLLADSYASQKQSPLRIALAQGGLPAQTILAQLYNEVNLQGGRLEEKFPWARETPPPGGALRAYPAYRRWRGPHGPSGDRNHSGGFHRRDPKDPAAVSHPGHGGAGPGPGPVHRPAHRKAFGSHQPVRQKAGGGGLRHPLRGRRHPGGRRAGQTLNYAAGELSKVDELRRELLANVSHDLRTPLTMIEGYAEVMRDLPGENTPENVQIIIDETQRLTNLVNDLLDLSKLEAGVVPWTRPASISRTASARPSTATTSWRTTASPSTPTGTCSSPPTSCASPRWSITW